MRALLATQFSIVPHGGRYYTKSAFAAILRRYGAAFGPLTLCVPVKQTWSPLLEDVTEAVSQMVPVSRNDSILRRQRREMTRAIRESDLVIVLPLLCGLLGLGPGTPPEKARACRGYVLPLGCHVEPRAPG